jgi:hypothetical protein
MLVPPPIMDHPHLIPHCCHRIPIQDEGECAAEAAFLATQQRIAIT